MGNLEALGDAVTGGMVGRAVEPAAGEGADGHTHETHCLNCRTELVGDYCHACGQHAHVHRTLSAFLHDFLHGVFHLEGKIWRTLPLLAWKPGELTRSYIDGQRARFVSPIALFLFSVFLMFAAVGLTGGFDGPTGLALNAQVNKTVVDTRAKIAELGRDRAAALKQGRPTAGIDARLADARAKLAEVESVRVEVIDAGADQVEAEGSKVEMPFWVRGMMNKANGNPQLLAYKIKSNAYKFSWALIPISAAFVWLLFPFNRKYRLYDHTVFVTYSLSFMTLLFALYVLLSAVGLDFLATIASLVPPVHMYRQLRGTYALGVKGALWRTVLLVIFAFVAVTLFSALLVGVGLFD